MLGPKAGEDMRIIIIITLWSACSVGLRLYFLRNRMLPRHLEDVLYLRVNRHLLNEVTIQMIMDGPQPAPVVEIEEVQETN